MLFDNFLSESKPIVGYANGTWHSEPYQPNDELCSIHHYDACFNAIRKDALEILLPYCEEFDDISWWWSQVILYTVGGLLFRGANIQNNRIGYKNLINDGYPKDNSNIERLSIPTEFAGSSFIDLDSLPPIPHTRKIEYPVEKNAPVLNKKKLGELVCLEHAYWTAKREFWEETKGTWL